MSARHVFGIIVFLCIIIISWNGVHGSDLIFHADFEDSVNAFFANGNPAGSYRGNSLKFAPGKNGKGLVTGGPNQYVRYNAKDNIYSDSGTVTFWVKAMDDVKWHQQEKMVCFFRVDTEGSSSRLTIYKYTKSPEFWVFISWDRDTENPKEDYLKIPFFSEDEWHFFALTWNYTGIKLYLDGVLCCSSNLHRMPENIKYIDFGQFTPLVPTEDRVMDELKIYKRALNKYEIMNLYRQELQLGSDQIIPIPFKPEGIELNGDDDQWIGSTRVPLPYSIESGGPVEPFTWANLAYDDQYLYFRLHTPTPQYALDDPDTYLAEGVVRANQISHDSPIETDDAYDLRVVTTDPLDVSQQKIYRFLVNGINTKSEYSIDPDNEINLGWDPDWETRSDVKLESWSVEGKIPFSAFGKTPEAGEIWGLSIFRIWQQIKKGVDSLSAWGTVEEPGWAEAANSMSRIIFTDENTISVSIDEAAGFFDGTPTIKFTLSNPDNQAKECRVIVSSADNTTVFDELIVVPANDNNQVIFSDPDYYQLIGSGSLFVKVIDQQQNELLSLEFPMLAQEGHFTFKYHPLTQTFSAIITDVSVLGNPADMVGRLILKNESTMEVVELKEIEISDLPAIVVDLDMKPVPEGVYEATIKLKDCGTMEVFSETHRFEKQPPPSWLGNEFGISETPPVPWTPIEVSGETISTWGREYTFGTLLPVNITTQGTNLLGEPAYLEYAIDGDVDKISGGQISIEAWNAVKADLAGEINKNKWSLINNSFVEFDGMVWSDIKFNVKQDLEVNKLAIVFPLKGDVISLFYPFDYSSQSTGYLPEEGWAGPIQAIWLGNEEIGMQFFWESDAGWQPASRSREVEVFRDGNKVFLKMNLIDKAVAYRAGEEVHFAFGFQATPVKKVDKFRELRIGNITSLSSVTGEPDVVFFDPWLQGWSKSPSLSNYPIPSDVLPPFEGVTSNGRRWFEAPYYNLRHAWTKSPEFQMFRDEWMREPDKEPAAMTEFVCPAPSYRDFFLDAVNQLCERTHVPAIYIDASQPLQCYNPAHDEHEVGATTILAYRELMKRIYTKLKEHDPNTKIVFHASGRVYVPIFSFVDFRVDGENFHYQLDREQNRGYEHILRLDTFRTEFIGYNQGFNSIFLPQFERTGSITRNEWKTLGYGHADYVVGLTLLHDSLLWVAWMPEDVMKKVYAAFNRINWGNDWEFIPYWKQSFTQPLPIDEVGISFYRDPVSGAYMAVVLNATDSEKNLDLNFDLTAMGFENTGLNVTDLLSNQEIDTNNESCNLTVPAYSYRLLLLH